MNAVDANDPVTGAHVRRVAAYSLILARAAELDEREQRSVERVALFHDIGKIHAALFDIVHEASPLSKSERELIATHPKRGADVMRPLSVFYPDLSDGVLSHHERWDGTGYPRRLRGIQIPRASRIVAIADTFDVITHSRPYKEKDTVAAAADSIGKGSGTQFDPELTDLFLQPSILALVARAVSAAQRQGAPTDDRRHPTEEEGAPDITFRWRSATREQPLPDPALETRSSRRQSRSSQPPEEETHSPG